MSVSGQSAFGQVRLCPRNPRPHLGMVEPELIPGHQRRRDQLESPAFSLFECAPGHGTVRSGMGALEAGKLLAQPGQLGLGEPPGFRLSLGEVLDLT